MPQEPGDKFEGYAEASAGDYDFHRLQAAITIPILGDALSARFAVDLNHRRGYTQDVENGKWYDGRDYQAYRAYVVARPVDGLVNKTLFNFAYGKPSDAGSAIVAVNPTGLAATYFPGVTAALAAQQARGPRLVDHDLDNGYAEFRALSVSNQTSYALTPKLSIENIFGYNDSRVANIDDTDGSPYPLLGYVANGHTASYPEPESPFKSVSEEIRLKGSTLDNRLEWTGGLFYEHRYPASNTQQDLYYALGSYSFSQALKHSTSKAIYGQAAFTIVPRLKLTGGARYTWDDRSQTTTSYSIATPCYTALSTASNLCGLHQSASFSAATWNASLQYELASEGMVYGSVRRGYKSGGFNTTAPTAALLTYQPEYVTSYELGLKHGFDVGGQRGHLNIELYDSVFSNKQITGTLSANNQSYSIISNFGSGTVKGLDMQVDVTLFKVLNLSGLYAHTASHMNSVVLNGISQAGAPLAGISKDKLSATAELSLYKSPDKGNISGSLTYSYQSSFLGSTSLSAPLASDPYQGRTPRYALVDARVDWAGVAGRPVDLAIYVTNLMNSSAIQQINNLYSGLGYDTAMYVPPRMVAGSLRYHF